MSQPKKLWIQIQIAEHVNTGESARRDIISDAPFKGATPVVDTESVIAELKAAREAMLIINTSLKDNKTYTGNHGQHMRVNEYVNLTEAITRIESYLNQLEEK